MYGIQGNSVLDLTPEKFEAINKNKDDLKRIRESLKVLKKTTLRKKLMQNLKNMKKTRIVKEKEEKKMPLFSAKPKSDSPLMKKMIPGLNLKRRAKLLESLQVKEGGDGLVEAIVSGRRKNREYIPLTFDGLMVDFGQSAERKAIW